MNPFILVGLDLLLSALLVAVAMVVVWNRLRLYVDAHMQSAAGGRGVATKRKEGKERAPRERERAPESSFEGGWMQRAAGLRKKGLSVEQIARDLKIPTREIETLLAISEMGKGPVAGGGMVRAG